MSGRRGVMQVCDWGKSRKGGNTKAGGHGCGEVEVCATDHGEKHGGLIGR